MATTDLIKPKKTRSVPLVHAILIALFVGMVGFVGGTRSDELVSRFDGKSAPGTLDYSSLDDVYSVLRKNYAGTLDRVALIE